MVPPLRLERDPGAFDMTAMTPSETGLSAAQIAKAALRRLAVEKREPTPENFAHAYEQEGGSAPPRVTRAAPLSDTDEAGAQLAGLIERLLRGIERGSKGWTTARKKDGVQRVLEGSRSDAQRLMQRLNQLVTSWEASPVTEAAGLEPAAHSVDPAPPAVEPASGPQASPGLAQSDAPAHPQAADAAQALHRERLVEQLGALCAELAGSMAELAESDSWVKGQCQAMHSVLEAGISARAVKAVNELLRNTRKHQGSLRAEREQARAALKELMASMLASLGELGSQTGRFHDNVGRYTQTIEQADTLESLTSVVREMVDEARTVHGLVARTRTRLDEEHSKAQALSERVNQLEGELRRLSDEVTTDQLTQIANRRGLVKAFDVERARMERSGEPLAVGLLDIDNFKRLNDELGHGVGDEALKALATLVAKTLRLTDLVARYGGEEFVVLLPQTSIEQAQTILTRLQRKLSSGLFLHEDKDVFVTFSAGVTGCGAGEPLEAILERADRALYEAKRTGKNRTCIG
jgi:diguanylate cyclase